MVNKYAIVNPFIHGNIKPIIKADDKIGGARAAYKLISSKFSNNIPQFFFSLQKINKKTQIGGGNTNDYYHFKVSEKRGLNNNKAVKFSIEEIPFSKEDNEDLEIFIKDLNNTILEIKNSKNHKGGANHDSDNDLFSDNKSFNWDDDDDDDDDIYDLDDDDDDVLKDNFLLDIYKHRKNRSLSSYYGYYYSPYVYNRFFGKYLYMPTFTLDVSPYIKVVNNRDKVELKETYTSRTE
tara:strand:- start:1 stop:708 length:708 start_codon:yes stop_codon:yes gene_type:complete